MRAFGIAPAPTSDVGDRHRDALAAAEAYYKALLLIF